MLTSATPNEPRPVDDGAAASGGGSHQSLDRVDTIKLRSEKGPRFWLIFLAICVSAFLAALELTSLSTALPTIVQELHGDDFVWVGSAYPLAATALLPASGGLAEVFGRRVVMLSAICLFALGSALCGSAQSMSWLIAARTIQGAGGGAIQSVSSIVVSDLVPLRERGMYNGFLCGTWALATAIAPLVGGLLAERGQWRWIFYLNLPISGVSAILVTTCMKLKTPEGTVQDKLRRMDWIGNFLVVSSTTSVAIALTWAGVQYPWGSARVVVPLVIGTCGQVLFIYYEARVASNPIVPISLFTNRTSLSGYMQTFLTSVAVTAVVYYLAVYYQACKDATPIRGGLYALGMSLAPALPVIVFSASVVITKAYRPQLIVGWIIMTAALAGLSTVKWSTPVATSIGLSYLIETGGGVMQAGTYFPVLAPLPVSENAHALAFVVFCHTFATVWGVTIGGTILQNGLHKRLPEAFLAQLPEGAALAYSAIPLIKDLPEPLGMEVRVAFGDSVQVIWQVIAAVSGLGLLSALLMKGLPLEDKMDEKWGIDEEKTRKDNEGIVVTSSSTVKLEAEAEPVAGDATLRLIL